MLGCEMQLRNANYYLLRYLKMDAALHLRLRFPPLLVEHVLARMETSLMSDDTIERGYAIVAKKISESDRVTSFATF